MVQGHFPHAYGVTLDLGELEGPGAAVRNADPTLRAGFQAFLDHARRMRAALVPRRYPRVSAKTASCVAGAPGPARRGRHAGLPRAGRVRL